MRPHPSPFDTEPRVPLEHEPYARLSFPTWREPEDPFPLLHRDALRGREPSLLSYLAIPHLKPRRPRAFHLLMVERPLVLPYVLLSIDTRRGDHLLLQRLLLPVLRVQFSTLWLREPRLQAQVSHPELQSLLQILRFLLTCHRSQLSNVRCSQHYPLRVTQIVEQGPFTGSYMLIKRPCESNLSSETLTAYSRGTTLSTS